MRGFASVFGREVRRLRLVLLAAVVFAIMEWPVAHFVQGWSYGEALTILAMVIATSLGAAYALIIGATVLARDVQEGAIAFAWRRASR
jgi:predicted PurR-regulated permease PerM